jgi:hypothetical protein
MLIPNLNLQPVKIDLSQSMCKDFFPSIFGLTELEEIPIIELPYRRDPTKDLLSFSLYGEVLEWPNRAAC